DDGGDGGGVMQRHQALELVGEMSAPLGLAARIGLLGAIVGVRQMIDAGQHGAEELAVGDHSANADAAEIDAVIAALAADEPGAAALALGAMIGKRDLERGIGGFRSGIAEE